MPLEIRTTWAKLGIQTTRAFLEMSHPIGQFKRESQRTELVIDRTLPRVLIDQSACFKECGLKNPVELTAEMAEIARQKVLEHTGMMAEEGNRLAQIENPADAVAEIALTRMEQAGASDWTFTMIPRSRPQIEVIGDLKIDWQVIKGRCEYQREYPRYKFHPGAIKFYLEQRGGVEIRYVDRKV
jgi:hypothetical protein